MRTHKEHCRLCVAGQNESLPLGEKKKKAVSFILSSHAYEKHSRHGQIGSRAMTHPSDIIQQTELEVHVGNTKL